MKSIIDYVDGFALDFIKDTEYAKLKVIEPNFADFADWQNQSLNNQRNNTIDLHSIWFAVKASVRMENGDFAFKDKTEFDKVDGRLATAIGVGANNWLFAYSGLVEKDITDSEKKDT